MAMIVIRFPDALAEKKALGFLPGRFSFTSWASGDMLVPEAALPHLAVAGISYSVQGPASYEQIIAAFRGSAATPVQ